MNMLSILWAEYQAFKAAPDGHKHVVDRVGALFDTYVGEPDIEWLPDVIENNIVDPTMRKAVTLAAGVFYDIASARFAKGEPMPWPALPDTETTDGD
jgi:hypothetical protein